MTRHTTIYRDLGRAIVALALLLSFRGTSFSQCAQCGSSPLCLTVTTAPISSLSVGDIDFKTGGSTNWFFTLSVQYSGNHPHIVMDASVTVNLADGTSIENPALTFSSFPFTVDESKTVTNLDIGKSTGILTNHFDYSQDAKDKLQKLALGTGKLPAGTYVFDITVSDQDNPTATCHQVITFNLQNISRVDLIGPQDGSEITSPFPFFSWIYDGTDVQLSVYELRAQDQSKEDALSGTPMLQVTSGQSPDLPPGARTYQYPPTSVRPLQPGHTYVWQVKGLTSGSGGSGNTVNSEIWQFTINDPTSGTARIYSNTADTTNSTITKTLYLLPNMTQDLINALISGNFTLTGNLLVNGVPVTAADAAKILAMLAANPDKVIEITFVQ